MNTTCARPDRVPAARQRRPAAPCPRTAHPLLKLTPGHAEPASLAEHPIRRKQVLGGLTHEHYLAALTGRTCYRKRRSPSTRKSEPTTWVVTGRREAGRHPPVSAGLNVPDLQPVGTGGVEAVTAAVQRTRLSADAGGEGRRPRGGELHNQDHPLLGIFPATRFLRPRAAGRSPSPAPPP